MLVLQCSNFRTLTLQSLKSETSVNSHLLFQVNQSVIYYTTGCRMQNTIKCTQKMGQQKLKQTQCKQNLSGIDYRVSEDQNFCFF